MPPMQSEATQNPPSPPEGPAAESVVTFAEGLVGLPSARRFEFLVSNEIEPLLRMRCLDAAKLSFLVIDPTLVLPGYQPAFSTADLGSVGLAESDPRLVLAIACIASAAADSTANLLAPLLINPATLLGRQVILEPQKYSSRHLLVPPDAGSR